MIEIHKIDKKILWYVIGYIVTDGSLSKDGRHINITSKDHDHLMNIKEILKLNSKIGKKYSGSNKEKKYSYLAFSDINFYHFLINIGIVKRKSWHQGKIKVDSNYFGDFLRGIIDGDGCISSWKNSHNNHTQWALRIYTAARDFMYWLKDEIETTYKVRGKIYSYKKSGGNFIHIVKFGKIATQVILKKIYYTHSFCLKRKNVTSIRCLLDTSKMINYDDVIARVL